MTDILDSIQAIQEFTAGMSFEEFVRDRKTVYAVTRALETISEASRRLPEELEDRHPEIDWLGVAAAGNIYRHEYEGVDEALLWHTVEHDLEPLREAARDELLRGYGQGS